jgi:DHA2 family multidrug resistance protein
MTAASIAHGPALARGAKYGQWTIAFTVTLATFMEVLDTSIANVALPHIAGGLSSSVDESTWVLTAYLVANAIVLPLSAWMAGVIGRKRFYMSCVAVFTVSSFLCGVAPTLGSLIVFRIIQGAGGGGLQPSEQAILADTFAPENFGMAFAMYGMAVVLAPTIGPTLGGWITDHFSWRWIFFINIPIGLISMLLTYEVVEDPEYLKESMRNSRGRSRIDYAGLLLIVAGLGCMQVVLDRGQEEDWFGSHLITFLAVVSAVSLVAFVIWEWRRKDPILNVRLFANRSFGIAALMMFVLGFTLYGATILLPIYVQQLMGYTSQLAGMVLSPGGLVMMVMMPIVGMLNSKVQSRWMIAIGFTISAAGFYYMTSINPHISYFTAMSYRMWQSAGLAFLFVSISATAYAGMPQGMNNQISSISNLMRNVGGSVGIALLTTLVVRRSQFHQNRLSVHATPYDIPFRRATAALTHMFSARGFSAADAGHQAIGRLYGAVQMQAAALAYVDAAWVMAVACACMLPLVFLLKRNDPGQASAAVH